MKRFKITHLHFPNAQAEYFTEEKPFRWLISKEYFWWYEGSVLPLKVGESIKTDFREITRLE